MNSEEEMEREISYAQAIFEANDEDGDFEDQGAHVIAAYLRMGEAAMVQADLDRADAVAELWDMESKFCDYHDTVGRMIESVAHLPGVAAQLVAFMEAEYEGFSDGA